MMISAIWEIKIKCEESSERENSHVDMWPTYFYWHYDNLSYVAPLNHGDVDFATALTFCRAQSLQNHPIYDTNLVQLQVSTGRRSNSVSAGASQWGSAPMEAAEMEAFHPPDMGAMPIKWASNPVWNLHCW